MGKKRSLAKPRVAPVTAERAGRLIRLLRVLGKKPLSRDALVARLGMGVRAFYRDLHALRSAGIDIALVNKRYVLAGQPDVLMLRLPFPDPGLTLGEAMQLAKGKGSAHRKLRALIAAMV